MANEIIKNYAKKNNVKMWQIANRLGYKQDGTLSRKLRIELDGEDTKKIMQIIDALAEERDRTITGQIRGARCAGSEVQG